MYLGSGPRNLQEGSRGERQGRQGRVTVNLRHAGSLYCWGLLGPIPAGLPAEGRKVEDSSRAFQPNPRVHR
jgi:hypothetical protein